MKLPFAKCPDCGREVDARRHNLRAHRRTHGLKGSNPVAVPDLFPLQPLALGEVRGDLPVMPGKEVFKLQ